jgi:hypothetical protein
LPSPTTARMIPPRRRSIVADTREGLGHERQQQGVAFGQSANPGEPQFLYQAVRRKVGGRCGDRGVRAL